MLSFNSRVGLRRILQNWTLKGKAVTSKLVTSKHQCECVLSTRFELAGQQKKEDLWPRRDCPWVLVWEACELMYYPLNRLANDTSATSRKIHDVTMTPKHIDLSCGIRWTFFFLLVKIDRTYVPYLITRDYTY